MSDSKKDKRKGNRYGVDSGNFFKPKKFETPEDLVNSFVDYLEWNSERFFEKQEAIKSGDLAGSCMTVQINYPLTIRAFCSFVGIHITTFHNYQSDEQYKEYFGVCKKIKQFIEQDQIEGAAIGAYNSNLIARLIGLKDSQQSELILPEMIKHFDIGIKVHKKEE